MSGQENYDGRAGMYQIQSTDETSRLPVKHALAVWLLGSVVGWTVVAATIIAIA